MVWNGLTLSYLTHAHARAWVERTPEPSWVVATPHTSDNMSQSQDSPLKSVPYFITLTPDENDALDILRTNPVLGVRASRSRIIGALILRAARVSGDA